MSDGFVKGVVSYIGNVRGGEVREDTSRAGVIDDGLEAFPERIEQARRSWPEAQAADFERVAKRRYADRATGTEYEHVSGLPLLAVGGPVVEDIDCWFIEHGRLIFLRRADRLVGRTVITATGVRAGKVEQGPGGQSTIKWL